MSLLDKMLKAGSVKGSTVLSKSSFFNTKDPIQTELPIVNIAFCGSLKGGLLPGLTVVAGESKSFKTLLGLYILSIVGTFAVLGLTLLPLALTQKASPLVALLMGNNSNALFGSTIVFVFGLLITLVITYMVSYFTRNKNL